MNYLLKNSPRRRSPALSFAGVGIIAVLILLLIFAPHFLSSMMTKIISPFWDIEDAAGGMLDTKSSLQRQNNELSQKLAELESYDIRIKELEKENADLKEFFSRSISRKSVLAAVVRKPPLSAYDSLIIDAGVTQGVAQGDIVYALGHIPVGEVESVQSNSAKVTLYSTPGKKYDVTIGKKDIQATAESRGGGAFEIVVPRDVELAVGDPVTVPSIYPSVFGSVSTIIAVPARAFATVLFNSPINIHELRWVLVEHPLVEKSSEKTR